MSKFYSFDQLKQALPIAAPLMMLDLAEINSEDKSGVARKMVSANEPQFAGHFPGQPILPGVMQIAAMTQLSRLIFAEMLPQPLAANEMIALRQLKRIKFRKPVFPGMTLKISSQFTELKEDGGAVFTVSCETEAGTASSGTLTLAVVNAGEFCAQKKTLAERPAAHLAAELAAGTVTDSLGLMKILPHRPPFLLVDSAVGVGADSQDVYGYKCITGNDILMQGAPAGFYPSYLMIESGAQLGCAHVLSQHAGKLGIFLALDEANFYHCALPGDRLDIHANCDGSSRTGFAAGDFWVDDVKIADCQLKFVIMEKMI